MRGGTPFPSMTVLSLPPFPFPATALSFSNRPLLTTTLPFLSSRAKPRDLQFRGPFLEMLFSTRPAVIGSMGGVLPWERRRGNTTSFPDGDQLIGLNSRKTLNQTVSPVNFQIGMVIASQPEVKPAIVH
jgi:hypothetical protein